MDDKNVVCKWSHAMLGTVDITLSSRELRERKKLLYFQHHHHHQRTVKAITFNLLYLLLLLCGQEFFSIIQKTAAVTILVFLLLLLSWLQQYNTRILFRCFYQIWIVSRNCFQPTYNQNRLVYFSFLFTIYGGESDSDDKMMKLVFCFRLFQMKSKIKRNNNQIICQCGISFEFMSEKSMNLWNRVWMILRIWPHHNCVVYFSMQSYRMVAKKI